MIWLIFYLISLSILVLAVIIAIASGLGKYKIGRVVTPFNIMFGGVFLSTFMLIIPIQDSLVQDSLYKSLQVTLFSIFNTIQIFVIEGETSLIDVSRNCPYDWVASAYNVNLSIYYVVAPIMSFVFLISFFKNVKSFFKYINNYFNDVYIFSELSEKALALGSDIKSKNNKALIVFTGLDEDTNEQQSEFIERAKSIKAICFTRDILAIDFKTHYRKSTIHFFSIDEDEKVNMIQGLKIIEEYKKMDNVRLYVFAIGVESEMLLAKTDYGNMKVRRVNEIKSLVNRTLYDEGEMLFDNAVPAEDGMKDISVVIVGLGRHGTEMMKGFIWYCQMDGYRLKIDGFDENPEAEDIIRGAVPELSHYDVTIHSGVNVNTKSFADTIMGLDKTTFVFICLDSDEMNIRTAVKMRMLYERVGIKPVIQAVVKSSYEKKALEGITNYKGQSYDIRFIGDVESSYSADVIISSELEEEALQRHLKWGEEEEFWRYEYNYQSSIASAIHLRARIHCGVAGADKSDDELTDEERTIIESLEHRRWNAYMRTEGYVYSGSTDKSTRNDLGKMHHDLIEYDMMSDEEKRKDSKVGTI